MTTKEQEMKALQQIRDILSTLDADGWVNTAFEGCCDLAETNINDDFACSYKQASEQLQKELHEAKEALEDWKTTYKALEKNRDEFKEKTLSNREVKTCEWSLMAHSKILHDKEANAATAIVEYADNPSGNDFCEAVAAHRKYSRQAKEVDLLRAKVATL